ncbi:TatD family hydrolase [Ferrimonas marina]|uniref:TatD DNase family protein n=1 Tax=Ferrimonas marina TaxID=299255 RepID=A0A1M5XXG0_9GAMM|nr:TatD family hydrolase [Ferrimonas marina]SHI04426.1 TatD DNase family protein [Ferrimonas marina]
MSLTDIAVNLAGPRFDRDRDEVIHRARAAGVNRQLLIGSDLAESEQCLTLAQQWDGLFSTAGVHPHHASEWDEQSAAQLRPLLAQPQVIAVGECGLDYNRNYSPPAAQRNAFAAQLALAAELGMPVLLHCREAYQDFLPMLAEVRDALPGAVLHCFTGNADELAGALALDLHIGITGWVCDERRGTELRQLVTQIPPHRLLLETDAPYLLPRDLKPKPKSSRNEPAYLPHIARVVAELRDEPYEALCRQCEINVNQLFPL